MMRHRLVFIARGLMVAMIAQLSVYARADSPTTSPGEPARSVADQQESVRQRVARLEDRMFEISKAIQQSQPEQAARLVESLGASRGMAVQKQLDEIVARLRDEQFADAAERQERLLADLQTLLKIMIEEPDQLDSRKEEMDRLRSAKDRLDALIKEQQALRDEAQSAAMTPQDEASLREAMEKAKSLLERQRDLSEDTRKGLAKSDKIADHQAALREEAEAVTNSLKKLPGKPASDDMESAVSRMKAAEDWLRKEQALDAEESQQEAEEKLQSAIRRLQEAQGKLAEKRSLEEQAARQADAAQKTSKLAEDLKSGEAGDESSPGDGSEKGDDEAAPPSTTPPQTGPKHEDLKDASRLQEDAARKLEEKKPADAVKKQDEALKKLEESQRETEDALEQLRKEQQEEMLAALEARFAAMLARQQEVSKSTQRLVNLPRSEWKRSDELALNELSQGQAAIADQADKTLYVLTEDGSTVVFPQIVQQIRDDARDAAARLANNETSAAVRQIQTGIEDALNELLAAVRQQQEQRENEKQGQTAGQSGPQPLLPGSAELKLLRSCQFRVNQATQTLRTESGEASDVRRDRLNKLTRRQAEVAEMAKEMHEAMTKAQ